MVRAPPQILVRVAVVREDERLQVANVMSKSCLLELDGPTVVHLNHCCSEGHVCR